MVGDIDSVRMWMIARCLTSVVLSDSFPVLTILADAWRECLNLLGVPS